MELPIGARVRSRYRGTREGLVLAKDDPQVWVKTLAFPTSEPDPAAVRSHVVWCVSEGLMQNRQPVLWQFDGHQRVYWSESARLIHLSHAVARSFPQALDWNWFMVSDPDGSNPRGPYVMNQTEVELNRDKGNQVRPYPKHDRPTVMLSVEEVQQRFPRLCATISGTGYFTWREATHVVRDYLSGINRVWWGRTCAQVILDSLAPRHDSYKKQRMRECLQTYRPDLKTVQPQEALK